METENTKKNLPEIISMRGTGKFYLPENTFEFIPKKEGKPIQKDVKKYGSAKVYSTTGSDPKRVITLQCSQNDDDPVAELTNQFQKVMKSEYKNDVPSQIKPQGIILKNTECLKMTVNKKTRMIEVSFTSPLDPVGKRDYKQMFYEKIQEISKCLAIKENIIAKSK